MCIQLNTYIVLAGLDVACESRRAEHCSKSKIVSPCVRLRQPLRYTNKSKNRREKIVKRPLQPISHQALP